MRARIGQARIKRRVRDMSIKLSNTALTLMSAAGRREDRSLEPPNGAEQSALQEIVANLLAAGLAREIKAKAGARVWRRDEAAGKSLALPLTAAGMKAIAVEADTRSAEEGSSPQDARGTAPNLAEIAIATVALVETNAAAPANEPAIPLAVLGPTQAAAAPRGGTKIANVLELLQRDEGATLDEVIAVTGWLPHTTRAGR